MPCAPVSRLVTRRSLPSWRSSRRCQSGSRPSIHQDSHGPSAPAHRSSEQNAGWSQTLPTLSISEARNRYPTQADIYYCAGFHIEYGPMAARILVVDDDEAFCYAVGNMLRDAGYEVVEAHDFRDALPILEDGNSLSLMLTDIVLPGVNGFALARVARMRHFKLNIVYVSAYDVPTIEAIGPILRKLVEPECCWLLPVKCWARGEQSPVRWNSAERLPVYRPAAALVCRTPANRARCQSRCGRACGLLQNVLSISIARIGIVILRDPQYLHGLADRQMLVMCREEACFLPGGQDAARGVERCAGDVGHILAP